MSKQQRTTSTSSVHLLLISNTLFCSHSIFCRSLATLQNKIFVSVLLLFCCCSEKEIQKYKKKQNKKLPRQRVDFRKKENKKLRRFCYNTRIPDFTQ